MYKGELSSIYIEEQSQCKHLSNNRKRRVPQEKILWRYKQGFSRNFKRLKNQFFYDQNLDPKKVLLFGAPLSGKSAIASSISNTFDLPLISLERVLQRLFEKRRQKARAQKQIAQNEKEDPENRKDPLAEELKAFYMEYGVEKRDPLMEGSQVGEEGGDTEGDAGDMRKDPNYSRLLVLKEKGDDFVKGFNELLLIEEKKKGEDEDEDEVEEEQGKEGVDPGNEEEEDQEDELEEKVGLTVELAQKRKQVIEKDQRLFDRRNQIWPEQNLDQNSETQPERDFRSIDSYQLCIFIVN